MAEKWKIGHISYVCGNGASRSEENNTVKTEEETMKELNDLVRVLVHESRKQGGYFVLVVRDIQKFEERQS